MRLRSVVSLAKTARARSEWLLCVLQLAKQLNTLVLPVLSTMPMAYASSLHIWAACTIQERVREWRHRRRELAAVITLQRAARRWHARTSKFSVGQLQQKFLILGIFSSLFLALLQLPTMVYRSAKVNFLYASCLLPLVYMWWTEPCGQRRTRVLPMGDWSSLLEGFFRAGLLSTLVLFGRAVADKASLAQELEVANEFLSLQALHAGVLHGVLPSLALKKQIVGVKMTIVAMLVAFIHALVLDECVLISLVHGPVVYLVAHQLTHFVAMAALHNVGAREVALGDLRLVIDLTSKTDGTARLTDALEVVRAWNQGPLARFTADVLVMSYLIVIWFRCLWAIAVPPVMIEPEAFQMIASSPTIAVVLCGIIVMLSSRSCLPPHTTLLAISSLSLSIFVASSLHGISAGCQILANLPKAGASFHVQEFLGTVSTLSGSVCEQACAAGLLETRCRSSPTIPPADGSHRIHAHIPPTMEVRMLKELVECFVAFTRGLLVSVLPISVSRRTLGTTIMVLRQLLASVNRALHLLGPEAQLGAVMRDMSMLLMGVAVAHIGVHDALASWWQRGRTVECLETARQQSLQAKATLMLREAINSGQESAACQDDARVAAQEHRRHSSLLAVTDNGAKRYRRLAARRLAVDSSSSFVVSCRSSRSGAETTSSPRKERFCHEHGSNTSTSPTRKHFAGERRQVPMGELSTTKSNKTTSCRRENDTFPCVGDGLCALQLAKLYVASPPDGWSDEKVSAVIGPDGASVATVSKAMLFAWQDRMRYELYAGLGLDEDPCVSSSYFVNLSSLPTIIRGKSLTDLDRNSVSGMPPERRSARSSRSSRRSGSHSQRRSIGSSSSQRFDSSSSLSTLPSIIEESTW